PAGSRLHATAAAGPAIDDARLFDIVDVLEALAEETGRSVPQIAINWLLQRPSVSSVLIGARDETQLRQNLGAVGWSLTPEQVGRLDAVSAVETPYPYYPYWRGQFAERSPLPV
ncbi:aldo/keto reductase, partial [Xanthomonas sp. Kuri4-2]